MDQISGIHVVPRSNMSQGQTSPEILVMAGPWTQTWSVAVAQDRLSPRTQMAAQVEQIGLTPAAVRGSYTNVATGGDPDHRSLQGHQW